MGFFNIIIYTVIALLYNLFVHNLASVSYKDQQYNEKHTNTIMMLIIFGCLGLLVGKLIGDVNKFASNGLFYGGLLLLLTVLLTSWETISDEIRLGLLMGIIFCVVFYAHKYKS